MLCTGSISELGEPPPPSRRLPPPPQKKKHLDFSSKKLCLASIITQYVTGKRTTTAIKHDIDLHGYTHNKDLVDVFRNSGFFISYAYMLLLYDVSGLEDVSESIFIHQEIAKGVVIICIFDNADFEINTLTGNSQQAHRTNVKFVQRQSIEHKPTVENIGHSC